MNTPREHPYRGIQQNGNACSVADPVFEPISLETLHGLAWRLAVERGSIAVLRGHEAAVERLVACELACLPAISIEVQESLAIVEDSGLLQFAREAEPQTSWAIADLALLMNLDENRLEGLTNLPDPAAIFAPFVANASVQVRLYERLRKAFARSSERSRALCAGAMTFRLAEAYLRGVRDALPPTMEPLRPTDGELPVAIGSLFRRLALWWRTSSLPRMIDRLRVWLSAHSEDLRASLQSGAAVNEVLRGSDYLDVYVLAILLCCDAAFGLVSSAKSRLLSAGEQAIYKRFGSPLEREDIFGDGSLDFRLFEFEVVSDLGAACGLDAYRFEESFLRLAADGYFRSIAPEIYEHERGRAIAFVAIGALTAARRRDSELREAVLRCLDKLRNQRFGGPQVISSDIARKVLDEAQLDLPLI